MEFIHLRSRTRLQSPGSKCPCTHCHVCPRCLHFTTANPSCPLTIPAATMSFLARLFGGSSGPSSSIAKDRLSLIIASQRGSQALENVDMAALQKDVMAIITKHIKGAGGVNGGVKFQVKNEGEVNLLEMQVREGPNTKDTLRNNYQTLQTR